MSEVNLQKEQLKEALKDYFGDNVLFFIKFTQQQQWAQDLLNGKLFMNKIQYYRDLETETGVKGQGDCSELKSKIFDVNLQFTSHETKFSFPVKSKSVIFEYTGDENTPVFCITGLTIEDMDIGEFNEESFELQFPFSSMEISKLKNEFGEYVVVLEGNKFEKALGDKLLSENTEWIFDKVLYHGPNSIERIKAFSNQSPKRFLFKDLDFKHQKEFRLVLNKEIDNFMVFDIESLSEAGIVCTVEEFLNLKITVNYKIEKIEE